jgi:hypothetical protein
MNHPPSAVGAISDLRQGNPATFKKQGSKVEDFIPGDLSFVIERIAFVLLRVGSWIVVFTDQGTIHELTLNNTNQNPSAMTNEKYEKCQMTNGKSVLLLPPAPAPAPASCLLPLPSAPAPAVCPLPPAACSCRLLLPPALCSCPLPTAS